VSEEDAFDIMLEALSRQPAAADDKAEDNIRGVIDTTAQRLADNEPATGGPRPDGRDRFGQEIRYVPEWGK
jgi:hypothetical protein